MSDLARFYMPYSKEELAQKLEKLAELVEKGIAALHELSPEGFHRVEIGRGGAVHHAYGTLRYPSRIEAPLTDRKAHIILPETGAYIRWKDGEAILRPNTGLPEERHEFPIVFLRMGGKVVVVGARGKVRVFELKR